MNTRNETGRFIKNAGLDRGRLPEVSKYSYGDILRNINDTFVTGTGGNHLSWNGRIKNLRLIRSASGDRADIWYHRLTEAIPSEEQVYLILEDTKEYETKYLIYEAYPSEIITLLDEMNVPGEIYMVSKKYKWLIFKTYENTAYCTGDIHF